jgi:hypothetical protein
MRQTTALLELQAEEAGRMHLPRGYSHRSHQETRISGQESRWRSECRRKSRSKTSEDRSFACRDAGCSRCSRHDRSRTRAAHHARTEWRKLLRRNVSTESTSQAEKMRYLRKRRAWHSHLGQEEDDQSNRHNHDVLMSRPLLSRTKPDALKGIFQTDHATDLSSQHPSIHDANVLWDRFERNANPLIKIDFDWILKQVRSSSTTLEGRVELKDEDHAFVFCVYLMSVVSISPEECQRVLRQSKQALLSQYQAICEQALSRSNIFCITSTAVIRAIILYIVNPHPPRIQEVD